MDVPHWAHNGARSYATPRWLAGSDSCCGDVCGVRRRCGRVRHGGDRACVSSARHTGHHRLGRSRYVVWATRHAKSRARLVRLARSWAFAAARIKPDPVPTARLRQYSVQSCSSRRPQAPQAIRAQPAQAIVAAPHQPLGVLRARYRWDGDQSQRRPRHDRGQARLRARDRRRPRGQAQGVRSIVVIGSYPDTKLQVSGRNIKTGRPMEWAFPLWELWRDWGNVNGTATVIYANMATSTFAGRCQATR
jgi:hypothetical protein